MQLLQAVLRGGGGGGGGWTELRAQLKTRISPEELSWHRLETVICPERSSWAQLEITLPPGGPNLKP